MSRKRSKLTVNDFSGGFNTEINLLKEQPNICSDELNMLIQNDGSRAKRLGFDLEPSYKIATTGLLVNPTKTVGFNTFFWENAGGIAGTKFLVIQVGSYLAIHDTSLTPISDTPIYNYTFTDDHYDTTFSFTSVDGVLVFVTGRKPVYSISYNGTTFTFSTQFLRIRDLFGVKADADSKDLSVPENVQYRPLTLPDTHLYNLRNQTFNVGRYTDLEVMEDPIKAFYDSAVAQVTRLNYPSNSDNVNMYVMANPQDASDRLTMRYISNSAVKEDIGSMPAPKGYFIIDALERGQSRLAEEIALRDRQKVFAYDVTTLPTDKTPNGASIVCEFAGRVWYAGFSGEVEGGDLKSPRLTSYLFFSLLVKDVSDITKCYQEADPTSFYDSALVDTDGGFIRIEGAQNIKKIINFSNALFVFAENGIWKVSGSENTLFRATGYQVDRLTSKGVVNAESIVLADGGLFFWTEDGIYIAGRNDTGDWAVNSISQGTISKFYRSLSLEERRTVQGNYDSFTKKIHWIYSIIDNTSTISKELVYNLTHQAFTKHEISNSITINPKIVSSFRTNPYKIDIPMSVGDDTQFNELAYLVLMDNTLEPVTFGGLPVTELGEAIMSLGVGDLTFKYSFGHYYNTSFYDWSSLENEPYDAFLVSGRFSVTSGQSTQGIPYIYLYFRRTENGFDDQGNPVNPSSCMLGTQWDWSNSYVSGKWSMPRQAYRYTKAYTPQDFTDTFNTGFEVIQTKNRIRGRGKSVAIKLNSEVGKAMNPTGWAFNVDVEDND